MNFVQIIFMNFVQILCLNYVSRFLGSNLSEFSSVLPILLVGAGLVKRMRKPLGAHQSVRLSQVKENTALIGPIYVSCIIQKILMSTSHQRILSIIISFSSLLSVFY